KLIFVFCPPMPSVNLVGRGRQRGPVGGGRPGRRPWSRSAPSTSPYAAPTSSGHSSPATVAGSTASAVRCRSSCPLCADADVAMDHVGADIKAAHLAGELPEWMLV